jgi:RNA polymerase sigma factor (sigma-70 family)
MNVSNKVSGNKNEFIRNLYVQSHKELLNFLLRRSTTKQQAQDLSQEAYLRLLRVERTDLILQPRAYLFRIAANLIYEKRVSSYRHSENSTFSLEEVEELAGICNPSLDYESEQSLEHLTKIVEKLPATYQAILVMRKRDGLSHSEIATKLNISIHTVRKYLVRAVAECRKTSGKKEF